MKFHKINWDSFGNWWLPSYLKKPRMLAWLRVMLSPVKALYAQLLSFRDFAKEQILITNQTLVLQAEVQKLLSEPSVVIINQGNRREKVYTWFLTELLGISPVQYLYTFFIKENSQKKHYRYFLREQVSEFDFIVYLPDTYPLSEEMTQTLIAFIGKHKLPDKRFMILQVPLDQMPTPIGMGVSLPPELDELLTKNVLSYLNFLDTSTIVFTSDGTIEMVQDLSPAVLSPKLPVKQLMSLRQPHWIERVGLVASLITPTHLYFPENALRLDIAKVPVLSIALLIKMEAAATILIGVSDQGEIIVDNAHQGKVSQAVDLEMGMMISAGKSSLEAGQDWQSVIIIFKTNFTESYAYVDGQAQNTTPETIPDLIPHLFHFFEETSMPPKEPAPDSELSIAQMLVLDIEPTLAEVEKIDGYFEGVSQFYGL
ncbi:MAG TPA: hypothetical protein DCS93_35705 [Microscillaceae bacterium]|nr:hypothetical protein [Microscillaceae bacterium]